MHTLGLERVGFIDNDAVMSVAGKREGVQGPGVAVAVEGKLTFDCVMDSIG